ncbi:hypothetical protein QAD02_007117 [Eretmocerus hayati]|uniref:Uncharacterized protein n=1 Tax=Eretmocerus hayati TaxID=131215 RepID=A0ACC2N2S0_9HYME|nr:hypothetical protein QAD02_007117 [Eretmocerus hayati]
MSDTLFDDELESMQYYIVEMQDEGDPWEKFGLFVVLSTFVIEDDPIINGTKPKQQNAVRSSGGSWYVLYPDPPFSTDDVDMIDGYVKNPKSIPPSSWMEKKCVVLGIAETHRKALELLADMSKIKVSSKPVLHKKASSKKQGLPLNKDGPLAKKSKNVSRKSLLLQAKNAGLGRILQPLSEAVQNMAKPQVAHVATTDAIRQTVGTL